MSNYKWRNKEIINNIEVYDKFINWVVGEFDLYCMVESKILEVYFPNGMFSISSNYNEYNNYEMEIYIESKSKTACSTIKNKLVKIYSHLIYLQRNKESD